MKQLKNKMYNKIIYEEDKIDQDFAFQKIDQY